ncbi:MAG: hypothetical protein AVDCRST_MAG59-4171, partial [uncultured Thermomicrobiales bacterium]
DRGRDRSQRMVRRGQPAADRRRTGEDAPWLDSKSDPGTARPDAGGVRRTLRHPARHAARLGAGGAAPDRRGQDAPPGDRPGARGGATGPRQGV